MISRPLRTAGPPASGEPPARRAGVADAAALARAEAALRALSAEFAGWMAEEVARLEAARARFASEPDAPAARRELRERAHDLKGLGTTCGHPLVTRLCASLHRLLDSPAGGSAVAALADDHVAAVRAAADGSADAPQTQAACERLEARVDAELGGG